MTRSLHPMRSFVLGLSLSMLASCHASPDDAAGQARELSDSERREYAMGNLTQIYGKTLSAEKSNRSAPQVKAFADATIEMLVKTYLEHPEDNPNGALIMGLLFEMREPRSLPALLKALEWRTEVNEEHAVLAARTLAVTDIPAGDRAKAAAKLASALDRVRGKRPVDNRMRIEFLRALGEINDPAAAEVLTKVALTQSEEQNFLINNLAVEQLGRLASPASVPALIEALYLFDPSDPRNRLNQSVPAALVRIGKPALDPLLRALRGEDKKALATSQAYIDAVRARAPNIAATMSAASETKKEAAYALGVLGMPEAVDALIEASADPDKSVQLSAAVALASIGRKEADTGKIRDVLVKVYGNQEKIQRAQLLRAMQHLYDPGSLPFLLGVAKTPEDELPDIRMIALNAYALLANKSEAGAAEALIASDDSPYKQTLEQQNKPLLAAAAACDVEIGCWTQRLDDKDENVGRKASYMLARLGRGRPEAVAALVKHLDHPREMVRGDILSALDFVALNGSAEAVAKIDAMRKAEEGRASWNHVKDRALTTQAKLAMRR